MADHRKRPIEAGAWAALENSINKLKDWMNEGANQKALGWA
jgi:hypothetical protein